MVPLRKSAQTLEAPANPNNHQMGESGRTQTKETQTVSDYEQLREERIKENLERMQKLGIFDLSLKFKSVKPTRKNTITKTPRSLSPLRRPGPVRRSSRYNLLTHFTPFYCSIDRFLMLLNRFQTLNFMGLFFFIQFRVLLMVNDDFILSRSCICEMGFLIGIYFVV